MKNILIKTTAICLTAALVTTAAPNITKAMPTENVTETAIAGIPVVLGDYYTRNSVGSLQTVLATLKVNDEKATSEAETEVTGEGTSAAETVTVEETTVAESFSEETSAAEETAPVLGSAALIQEEEPAPEVRIALNDENFVKKEVRENNYKSVYAKIAVAQVEKYVNVRSTPDTSDSDNIVGRIYNNCAAKIQKVVDGEDGDWFYVKSGDVEGYIKADLFVTGVKAKKLAAKVGTISATALTESLRVRASASLDAEVLTQLEKDSTYKVLEEEKDGFVKVEVVDGLTGYVYAECVELNVKFDWAVSNNQQAEREEKIAQIQFDEKEADAMYFSCFDSGDYESAAMAAEDWAEILKDLKKTAASYHDDAAAEYAKERLETVKEYVEVSAQKAAETRAAREQAAAAAPAPAPQLAPQTQAPAPQTQAPTTAAPAPAPAPAPTPNLNTSEVRQAIVNEAVSWVGRCNYVYGGTNLAPGGGVDCSGFTLSIYKKIAGIWLSRCSYQQVGDGRRIGFDQLQPGDLVFYGDGGISHVAIYIGNGQIVHAKNPALGIGIDSLNYKAPIAATSILN